MAYVVRQLPRPSHGHLMINNGLSPSTLQFLHQDTSVGTCDLLLYTSPGSSAEHELSDDFEDQSETFGPKDSGPDRLLPTSDEFVTDLTKPVKIKGVSCADVVNESEWPLISVPTLLKCRAEAYGEKLALEGLDHKNR